MTDIELLEMAANVRENAHVPYSKFRVGAAIVTKNGNVYTGCNIECSSYGISICAERVALVKAVSAGEKEFDKIAVVGGLENSLTYTSPCGACRQFLSDFGEMKVILGYKENEEWKKKEFELKDLLPESFLL